MTEVSGENPSTHEEAPENAVWLLYQLDAVMGVPLHLLALHCFCVRAIAFYGPQTGTALRPLRLA